MRKCVYIRGWCDGNKRSLAEKVENVATPHSAISSALNSRLINIWYNLIRISLLFQGYEGSLLKVTSKNGKTSSVSKKTWAPKTGTRPLFRISLGKMEHDEKIIELLAFPLAVSLPLCLLCGVRNRNGTSQKHTQTELGLKNSINKHYYLVPS